MRNILLAAALTTAITASPPPPQYHTLSFTANNNTVTANLLASGKKGSYVLQAERPSVYQGSQAFFTGSGRSEGLIFLPNSYTTAGAATPDVGDNYGYAAPITVVDGQQGDLEWHFSPSTKQLSHKLDAALEGFFACATQVNGENATVLSWGVPKNTKGGLEAPDGCEFTSVSVGKYNSNNA